MCAAVEKTKKELWSGAIQLLYFTWGFILSLTYSLVFFLHFFLYFLPVPDLQVGPKCQIWVAIGKVEITFVILAFCSLLYFAAFP